MANDIAEIAQMLCYYDQTGYLDKNKAIQKILDVRKSEVVVEIELSPKNPATTVPYDLAPLPVLYNQLHFIRN